MKKKVLVIVAHPDDETIWMGGTLLTNKDNWDTTIVSLCRANDTDRAPKFKKVCKGYNAKCFMSDLDDEKLNKISLEEVKKRILQFVDGKSYDCIYTHGANGEYGHIRHKDVNKAVLQLVNQQGLACDSLFTFAYVKHRSETHANARADKFIKFNGAILLNKKELIKDVYGFNEGSFEERTCRNSEAFNKIK